MFRPPLIRGLMKRFCVVFFFCLASQAQLPAPPPVIDCEQMLLKKHRDAIVMMLWDQEHPPEAREQDHELQDGFDQAVEAFNQTAREYARFCLPDPGPDTQ